MPYPPTYRENEVNAILAAARAGESTLVIGLSGSGKSNLLSFLAQGRPDAPAFLLVDCNRLSEPALPAFLRLIRRALGETQPAEDEFSALENAVQQQLLKSPHGLCLLLDRFDALPPAILPAVSSNLRALRDAHKYRLSFVIASRQPLDAQNELAELFFAHTLWLGALSSADARWSAGDYAQRKGLKWDEAVFTHILDLSRGYPSFLRAICEAYSAGSALEPVALLSFPAVQARLEEFWQDQPSAATLSRCGLADHPLLRGRILTEDLTAHEHRLLEFLQSHPGKLCSKDDLIRAVWTEDKVFNEGIRDDSLAQLVHRLRDKIEPDPESPQRILTIPGRGYRYIPPG
jgi:energy-coupling factor transporter ATP-binding protein EcfA2